MTARYDTPEALGVIGAVAALVGGVLGFIGVKLLRPKKKSLVETIKPIAQRALLRSWGKAAEDAVGWPDLHRFLDVVALGESGWRLRPKSEVAVPGSNDAVGPYQIRPTSTGDSPHARDRFRADPSKLQEAGIATVAITDFFADNLRNAPYATWEELRASGAFPFFVHGRPTKVPQAMQKRWTLAKLQTRYDDSIRRFRKHLGRSGVRLNPRARAWAGPKRVDFDQLARQLGVET